MQLPTLVFTYFFFFSYEEPFLKMSSSSHYFLAIAQISSNYACMSIDSLEGNKLTVSGVVSGCRFPR